MGIALASVLFLHPDVFGRRVIVKVVRLLTLFSEPPFGLLLPKPFLSLSLFEFFAFGFVG